MLPFGNKWNSNEEITSSTSPTSIETGCVSPIISNRKNSAVGRGVGVVLFLIIILLKYYLINCTASYVRFRSLLAVWTQKQQLRFLCRWSS
ncbi:hypothetical protein CDAR_50071, partial [Caerostris darwini]